MVCEAYKESSVFRIGGDEFVVVVQGSDYKARHEIFEILCSDVQTRLCIRIRNNSSSCMAAIDKMSPDRNTDCAETAFAQSAAHWPDCKFFTKSLDKLKIPEYN